MTSIIVEGVDSLSAAFHQFDRHLQVEMGHTIRQLAIPDPRDREHLRVALHRNR